MTPNFRNIDISKVKSFSDVRGQEEKHTNFSSFTKKRIPQSCFLLSLDGSIDIWQVANSTYLGIPWSGFRPCTACHSNNGMPWHCRKCMYKYAILYNT